MMVIGQRSKRLKTVKQLRTYWACDTNTGFGRRDFVESEDEQEQRDNLEIVQKAVTMLRGTTDEAKETRRD